MPYGKKEFFLILHNIRSVHNVGSIFRTADAIGVTTVYLTGYTPAPVDRFGRARKDFSKVSLGAEKSVPWESRKNISALLRELQASGIKIIAVEQDAGAIDYKKVHPHTKRLFGVGVNVRTPTALIFGNEVLGIRKNVLKMCDGIVEIPMRGKKESLNVSVAAGIVLFRLFDRP